MPPFRTTNLEGRDRLGHIEEYLASRLDTAQREQIHLQGQGLVAETGPRRLMTGAGGATSSGTLRLAALALREGDTLTTAWWAITSNATSSSLSQSGVYLCSGLTATLVASSVDSSGWLTSGSVPRGASMALSLATPYVAPTDGYYLVGVLQVAGTTASVGTIAGNSGSWQVGSGFPATTAYAAQTSLAASLTLSSGLANGVTPWVGFS